MLKKLSELLTVYTYQDFALVSHKFIFFLFFINDNPFSLSLTYSGKPALSKVEVLERDVEKNCTLVKVYRVMFQSFMRVLFLYFEFLIFLDYVVSDRLRFNQEDHTKSASIFLSLDIPY